MDVLYVVPEDVEACIEVQESNDGSFFFYLLNAK
jgi:hypothetical protein